ncbi:MAG: oxidoreductase [Pseudobdellovibrio sp.]|jgi:NADP-dependent 3-hydroxy acid dehydrogenase YdfG|nr:oxidoreductase [Pseudobdellovibrio sp.]
MKKPQKKAINNWVLITGASSGIGEATAKALAAKGYSLVLTARRVERLKKLSATCFNLGAPHVHTAKCDVKNKTDIKKVLSDLKKQKISVKIVINNAGLAKGIGSFQESDSADNDEMIDTNVKGLLNITRELLPEVIKNRGHIVNLGSVAGRLVYEGGTVYCATKFAVRAISDALRLDLKGTGVRVTNIEPGMVNTEFSLVRLGNQQKADAVYSDMMPLSANDIAESILWCVGQPAHVNISELVIYPTDQASVGHVVRGGRSIKNLK